MHQCKQSNYLGRKSTKRKQIHISVLYIYENSSRNKFFFSLRHNVINFVSLISIDGSCFSDGLLQKKKIFPAVQDKVN